MRKLASIQRITSIDSIPGADRIEVVGIQGWYVVVQKDLYKVADKVAYFEVDSILPVEEWSKFMEPRKYRVKTIKLKKQISQGLCIPLTECLPETMWKLNEGTDLTETLGVTKHDPQAAKERAAVENYTQKKKQPHAWLLRWSLGRRLHQKMYPKASGSWPDYIKKTDETRVQNLPNIFKLTEERELYADEKLDGQSYTAFYKADEKTGLFGRGLFGVCSRNIWYKTKCTCSWWNITVELDIEERLTNFCKSEGRSIAIQGELVGEDIQGNRYNIIGKELYIFNVWDIDKQKYVSGSEKSAIIGQLSLAAMPTVMTSCTKGRTVEEFLEMAEGVSKVSHKPDVEREGLVFRDISDDKFSFKAVSNKFLLEGGE